MFAVQREALELQVLCFTKLFIYLIHLYILLIFCFLFVQLSQMTWSGYQMGVNFCKVQVQLQIHQRIRKHTLHLVVAKTLNQNFLAILSPPIVAFP